jgi:hypothetical protein
MAERVHSDVFDAALNVIKTNATRLTVCSTEPTTFTEANATYALADVTIDSADFTGPAAGDVTGGRKLTVGAQAGVLIDTSGTAAHVALLDVSNSKLLHVATCTSQALVANASNTVTVPAYDIELDP